MVSRIDAWRRCLIRFLAISKWRPLQSGKEGSRRDVDANGKRSRCRIPGREVAFRRHCAGLHGVYRALYTSGRVNR